MDSISPTSIKPDEPSSNGTAPTENLDNDTSADLLEGSFFDNLGLVGLEEVELPVLCSLVTGDPLLMIGNHGTAKTALASKLAGSLGSRFHAYDASKALFEDIIGFPNPDNLSQGELDYVPTPLSLWDKEFILVDEISRANAQTQSKWLEVIRSRRVMGEKLTDLQYVFAAMNPPGSYEGAQPLDPALAGRFAFVLDVPDVRDMDDEDQVDVMETIGDDDAPLAQELFKPTSSSGHQPDLKRTVNNIRDHLPQTIEQSGDKISHYLSQLIEALPPAADNVNLDGRRLGMIRRNILVGLTAKQTSPTDEMDTIIKQLLFASLPHRALGLEIPTNQFILAHQEAFNTVMGGQSTAKPGPTSGRKLVRQALENESLWDAIDDLAMLSRVLTGWTNEDSELSVSAETVRRIMSTGRQALDQLSRLASDGEAVRTMTSSTGSNNSKANILVGWWLVEKTEDRNFRLDEKVVDKIPGLIVQLTTRINRIQEAT